MPDNPKPHFQKLDSAIRATQARLENFKEQNPTLYWGFKILIWALAGVCGYLLWTSCEDGGWIMIVMVAGSLLLLFLVFSWDYVCAKQVNHQFFFKPWIMMAILFVVVAYLGNKQHSDQKRSQQDLITATNRYNELIQITNSQASHILDLREQLARPTKWRMKIVKVTPFWHDPNPGLPPQPGGVTDSPLFKFVAHINGYDFVFPIKNSWAQVSSFGKEAFPVDSAGPLTISFSGTIMRSNRTDMQFAMETEQPADSWTAPLSPDSNMVSLYVQDKISSYVKNTTQVDIEYEITTNR